ncbi:MAG: 30S ribosomal protein S20 [Candidatus Berkelbacteria bacterium Licking1014_7]|uniref:Small ribosomal subunit protein bS20 n=1 Tax=Candidatus Berkelbacteria bacterium Licking1014_7 TaxID=2017147 RepID=A0A554LI71_9BACT|nr:MAG: 30S ribosomal protein S20 [Candidatus Berkelbacteria bacterium Licking1014_7]
MPITKSAKKALRQTTSRTKKNQAQKKELNFFIKKITEKTLSATISKIDKAVKVKLLSKARANRIKSKLFKKIKPKALVSRLGAEKISAKPTKKSAKSKTTKSTPKIPAAS